MRRGRRLGLSSVLLLAAACASALAAPLPVPQARCAEVVESPTLDPTDPESVRLRWHDAPPIVRAMGRGRHDALRKLLASGTNPNVCLLGASPLALAVAGGDREEVDILLEGGAHPDLPTDSNGGTPLLNALAAGEFDIAQRLIAEGSDVHAATDGGATALYELSRAALPATGAQRAEQVQLALLLIDRGVVFDAPMGVARVTALMMAAVRGNAALVRALLARGADSRLTDTQGGTALDFARKKGHSDVVDILTAAMLAASGASSPE